jgi:uncharacterized protein YukE
MSRPLHLFLFHGLGADGDDLAPISDLITQRVALPDHHWQVHRPDAPVSPVSLNGGLPMPSWFDLIADNGGIEADRDSLAGITADLRSAAKTANDTFDDLGQVVRQSGASVQEFTASGLPQYTQLARETRNLIDSLERIAQQIERNPARFFLNRQTPEFRR